MITAAELAQYHDKMVIINVDTGVDGDGSPTFTSMEGKVLAVSDAGIIIRQRGNSSIIDRARILEVEVIDRVPSGRVKRRVLQGILPEDSVKQHLADRHGVLVSVLRAVDEGTLREMHDGYKHDELGHRHTDTGASDAVQRMQLLDGEEAGTDEDVVGEVPTDVMEMTQVASTKRKRVVRRSIRVIPQGQAVKQHLADRHDLAIALVTAIDPALAYSFHEGIDHRDLGHFHDERNSKE